MDQKSPCIKNHEHTLSCVHLFFLSEIIDLYAWIDGIVSFLYQMKRHTRSSFAIGLSLSTAFLVIVVRAFIVRRSRYNRPGSVEDLVRRGQLRSDRRGMYDSNPSSLYFLCP